ncbi:hypothetical protein BSG1_05549 [Bacillus sp. SG-1]|nr:hypothetical protein BSG1_05549 [Bacillus sp. SG-1]
MLVSKQEKRALVSKGKIQVFGFFREQQYIRKQRFILPDRPASCILMKLEGRFTL